MSETLIVEVVHKALDNSALDGKRVLVVIPDHTRTAPIPLMFRTLYDLLSERVAALDFMVALGTHPPMPMEHILRLVGITEQEHEQKYSKSKFFNHLWKDPEALVNLGSISEDEIERISGGLFKMRVNLTINKLVTQYDHVMIVGPVFPHEVVGFSGGNKYLFPGIAGQEIIDFFHWLGALITNPMIIGNKYTPVREVVDTAAKYVPVERSCFAMVVKGHDLAGIYYGAPEDAWSAAADLSDKLHITYVDKPFHTVLSCAPKMYDDIWTAGKCMYKLEPVVADGGKLIIYAPHIDEISYTHGKILDEIGYHTRDYFIKQWDAFKHHPWGVVAHSTHVKGIGAFADGVEKPRVEVVLATRIPEERCRAANLGYMDPDSIRPADYQNRESEGILYVPKAGETLYRLKGNI
ncbi:MAG: lactate racemase domain-containing protein [Armatimonadota bacterium]